MIRISPFTYLSLGQTAERFVGPASLLAATERDTPKLARVLPTLCLAVQPQPANLPLSRASPGNSTDNESEFALAAMLCHLRIL